MKFPFGYGRQEVDEAWLRSWLLAHHHPEYVARLMAWLISKGGHIGIGGGWRNDGTQPDKAGFAPEGKSFHQNQKYSDGFIGAAAVDAVARNGASKHRSPRWDEVPAQGGSEARLWGIHANVGTPGARGSESWHLQPVEIDGHGTFIRDGSPAPVPNYPYPGRFSTKETEMSALSTPIRWFDTRRWPFGSPLNGGTDFVVPVPEELKGCDSMQVNVTITEPKGGGHLTVWADGARPVVSNLNFVAGQTIANGSLLKVGSDGMVRFWLHPNAGSAHLVADVQGVAR